jgi:hypothetical protein
LQLRAVPFATQDNGIANPVMSYMLALLAALVMNLLPLEAPMAGLADVRLNALRGGNGIREQIDRLMLPPD